MKYDEDIKRLESANFMILMGYMSSEDCRIVDSNNKKIEELKNKQAEYKKSLIEASNKLILRKLDQGNGVNAVITYKDSGKKMLVHRAADGFTLLTPSYPMNIIGKFQDLSSLSDYLVSEVEW